MIAFSVVSDFQVRFPSGYLHLIIHIRDKFNSYSQFNLSSMNVLSNRSEIDYLIQFLATANLNTNNQIISSISQEINQLNQQNIDQAISSKFGFFIKIF
jgi:hypothetical protein